MRNIVDCIIGNIATPMNTTGMGGVSMVGPDTFSEPLTVSNIKKQNKNKSSKHKMLIPLKKYILQKINEDLEIGKCELNAFVILKPEFLSHEDDWCKILKNNGWQIVQRKKFKMPDDISKELYKMHKDKSFYNDLCTYMSSDDCICAMCYKDCDDPIGDMKKLKDKVRKAWGKDDMKNAMHSSDSIDNVNREYKLIFENKFID